MEAKRPPEYFVNEIRSALDAKLRDDNKVILLGEDIEDPFGGCFKVTQGLSTKYPGRVINTPISEAAIVGMGIGLAMQGFKPIIEIMFYDFITLAFDQIINHAIKYHQNWHPINFTIRTTIGKPDYGFQHTQDLDYIMTKVMKVIHPTPRDDVKKLLIDAIDSPEPTLFVEDSKYYLRRMEV